MYLLYIMCRYTYTIIMLIYVNTFAYTNIHTHTNLHNYLQPLDLIITEQYQFLAPL